MTIRAKTGAPSLNTKLSPAQKKPRTNFSLFRRALRETFRGLIPGRQRYQPAIFILSLENVIITSLFLGSLLARSTQAAFISGMASALLWITLLWLSFAQAIATKHLYSRAEALRREATLATAKRLNGAGSSAEVTLVPAATLSREDVILVEPGDIIPADGEVLDGIAAVDEHTLTGSREPAVRLVAGTLNAVSGGTRVRSGRLTISLNAGPDEGLAGRISGLAQEKPAGAQQPNFLLHTLTAASIGLTLLAALWLFATNSSLSARPAMFCVLAALLAALCPSPTAGLLAIADLAGLNHLARLNFIPVRDNILERLKQVTVVLLDQDAILIPNPQQVVDFVPTGSNDVATAVEPSGLVQLLNQANRSGHDFPSLSLIRSSQFSIRNLTGAHVMHYSLPNDAKQGGTVQLQLHQAGPEPVITYLRTQGISIPPDLANIVKNVIHRGGQPLVITQNEAVLGVLHLQQQIRKGLKDRVQRLRELGIQTILVTREGPTTAANLAAAVGADDFLASATGVSTLALVQQQHNAGQKTALTGCQPQDAAAIRHAGTGVALGRSAYPVREVADIIDLDSSPPKLLDLIEAGHQWQATRRALTVLGLTSDLVKFLIVGLLVFGIILPMSHLSSPAALSTAADIVLAGIVFNAISLIVLTPLALGWLPFQLINSIRSQRNIVLACAVFGLTASLIGMSLLPLLVASVAGGWLKGGF